MDVERVDIEVDLGSEDDSGLPWGLLDEAPDPGVVGVEADGGGRLPWGLLDEAPDPSRIREGHWVLVGAGEGRAVAQVADVDGDVVHVRPLPGPVARHRHLLGRVPAS